jgi:hypothetical protein
MSLTPALARALALGLLLGLLLFAWFAIVSPLIGMVTERQSDIETLQDRLATLRATIARIPELERRACIVVKRMKSGCSCQRALRHAAAGGDQKSNRVPCSWHMMAAAPQPRASATNRQIQLDDIAAP